MNNQDYIAQLVPAEQPLALAFIDQALTRLQYDLRITSAYRTDEEQAFEYAQGRGSFVYQGKQYNSLPGAKIVTHALPGQSLHNSHRAFDVVERTKGYDIDWAALANLGSTLGLYPGRNFGDNPHFEYHGAANLPPTTTHEVVPPAQDEEEMNFMRTLTTDEAKHLYEQVLGRQPENDQVLQNRTEREFLYGAITELKAKADPELTEAEATLGYQQYLLRDPHFPGDNVTGRHLLEFLRNAIIELQARLAASSTSAEASVLQSKLDQIKHILESG